MMKRTDYLSGILLLALAAATGSGCNNHDEPTRTDGQRRMVTLSAKAEIGTKADSRVAATDNAATGGGISLAWEATDKITIVSQSSDGAYTQEGDTPNVQDFSLTVSSSDNGAATFTGSIAEATDADKTYYAFYPPLGATGQASGTVPHVGFDLSTQTGALDANNTYMAARAANPDDLGNVSFAFSHLTALLKITPVISGVDAGTALTDVTISGNYGTGNPLLHKGTYTIHEATATDESSNVYGNIRITGGDYKTGTPIYCYLVGGSISYTNVTISATTADGKFYTGEIIGATGKALAAGKAYAKTVTMDLAYEYDATSQTYTVYTGKGLQAVNSLLTTDVTAEKLSSHITLADDITLDAPPTGGSNWEAIGNWSYRYAGTFNGNGKSITGLVINSTDSNLGLFSYLHANGRVENLTLIRPSVTSIVTIGTINSFICCFVAQNYGTISGCKVSDASVTGKTFVGGIAGFSQGTISDCEVSGNSSVTTNMEYGGGIAGRNTGTISGSKVIQSTISTSNSEYNSHTGGIAGENEGGTISDCTVSDSSVNGYSEGYTGGIAGVNTATISSCNVSATSVTGNSKVGGIVGENQSSVLACYAGEVTVSSSDTNVGGIVGSNTSSITGCFAYQCEVKTTSTSTLDATANICASGTVASCYYTTDGSSFGNVGGDATHTTWETIMSAMNAALTGWQWGGTADSPTLKEVSSTQPEGAGSE